MKKIDLAQKNCICDVITLAISLRCDIIKAPSVQTWSVYFFVSVQPLSTNFASHLCGAGEPTSGRTVSGRGDISVDQIENAQTWAHNDVDNSRHRHQIIAGKTCKRIK